MAVIQKVGPMPRPPTRASFTQKGEEQKAEGQEGEAQKAEGASTSEEKKGKVAKGEEPETLEGMDLSHDTPAPARKKSKKRLEKEKELKKKEEPFLPLSESLQGVWESMRYEYKIL